MNTYQMSYLGEVVDEADFPSDAAAMSWRDDYCTQLMADQFPSFLTSDDFEDLDDCRNQFRVRRLAEADAIDRCSCGSAGRRTGDHTVTCDNPSCEVIAFYSTR